MADTTAVEAPTQDPSSARRFAEFWYYFSENRGAVLGLGVFVVLVFVAVLAPLIAPHAPNAQYRDAVLVPPFWEEGGRAAYLLGTDAVGRDILSRLLYGARFSLFIGVIVTTLALVGGIVVGVVAGFYRGWVDDLLMRIVEAFQTVPSFVLALALVAVLGPSLASSIVAVAISSWTQTARLVRGEYLSLRDRDFVRACRALGMGDGAIMFRHILPNILSPVTALATMTVAVAILVESALAFLGLGDPSVVSWGAMIGGGRALLRTAWYVAAIPGMAIAVTVLGITLFGEGLNAALDPRRQARH